MPFRVSRRLLAMLLVLAPAPLAASDTSADDAADGEPLTFTHVLDDAPLDVRTPRPDESFTPAVEEFHVTGANPYRDDEAAIDDGQAVYARWCQACHLPDGSGRIGPALNDDQVRRERAATDKGEFEIIYGGSAGAMQAFGDRIDQDDILRLMAFTATLRPE